MQTLKPAIEMKNIQQSFHLDTGRKIKVLDDVNMTVHQGEVLVLLGPSGSGKSTCLRILTGLLKPSHGKVFLDGKPLHQSNPDTALVFQSFALLPWKNVAANVATGIKPLGLTKEEVSSRVKKAIDLVGLEGFEEAYPKEHTGGMKQRVGIARALVMERPILCLDEPFSALDVLTAETLRKEVLNLWLSKKTAIKAIVLVTHNITEAVSMGSRILVVGSGKVRFSIRNDLNYPRDEKSSAFKNLVDNMHDLLTETIIPDTADWIPPALASNTIESLPHVSITEVDGFLEVIGQEDGKRADAFLLAKKLMKDSVQVLILAKAAELLDLVDTPKNQVVLTDLGKAFVSSDVNEKKKIVHRQMKQLRLTQLIHEKLLSVPDQTLPRSEVIQDLSDWLPNENPERVLDTLLQWGRYGELFGYNADTMQVYIDNETPST